MSKQALAYINPGPSRGTSGTEQHTPTALGDVCAAVVQAGIKSEKGETRGRSGSGQV